MNAPRDRERSPSNRSCQPMHVLSFVGGRKFWLLFVVFGCGVLVILSLTWRLLGRHSLRLFEWRFDCVIDCVVFVFRILVLGVVSGLEAFSREPTCDSFGALAVRQTPYTSGTAWEFLSYYPILPSQILRVPSANSESNYTNINVIIGSIVQDKMTCLEIQGQSPLRFARVFLAISG